MTRELKNTSGKEMRKWKRVEVIGIDGEVNDKGKTN